MPSPVFLPSLNRLWLVLWVPAPFFPNGIMWPTLEQASSSHAQRPHFIPFYLSVLSSGWCVQM